MGMEPSPTSLLGSGTERPLPGCGASLLHHRLLAFISCRSFPGHPGQEPMDGAQDGAVAPWRVHTLAVIGTGWMGAVVRDYISPC